MLITAILLGTAFVLMLIGLPIAFSILAASIVALTTIGNIPLMVIPQNIFTGLDSFSLLAIPFFVLAGSLMTSGGITEKLLDLANSLMGRFRGGLAMSAVLSSAMFAGISGSAVADTSALGRIMIPAMKKAGYPANFSAGVLAAANVMAPIIPPSIPFIVVATLTNQSVTTLFLAGLVPGLFYMATMLVMTSWISKRRGYPMHGRSSAADIWAATKGAIYALLLPVFVIGGIRTGVFNITECAVVAAVYALFVGVFVYRKINLRVFLKSLESAARTTAVIMMIVAAAKAFSWVMAYVGIPRSVADFMLANISDPLIFLILVNIILLIVGMFIETNAAIVMLMPVFFPIAVSLGIDPTHFSVLMVVNLCIGLITPPAGLCLNIATVLAGTTLEDGFKGVLPFFLMALFVIAVLTVFPQIVLVFT
ncbi:TRAP transporter large permease [Celeribacter sp.]|uniref:TRAP transporter large permease n=1 Tax=Celeribacter sp. TaxID=1890673 RepID=UPI003A952C02